MPFPPPRWRDRRSPVGAQHDPAEDGAHRVTRRGQLRVGVAQVVSVDPVAEPRGPPGTLHPQHLRHGSIALRPGLPQMQRVRNTIAAIAIRIST